LEQSIRGSLVAPPATNLIFHFSKSPEIPAFFFEKCRSRFSGQISQALQFFEDSIPGRRLV
jgi:hypothetical protein